MAYFLTPFLVLAFSAIQFSLNLDWFWKPGGDFFSFLLAQFAHYDVSHFIYNVSAIFVLQKSFKGIIGFNQILLCFFGTSLITFLEFQSGTSYTSFGGLSGFLHAIFTAGVVLCFQTPKLRVFSIIVLFGLFVKLYLEQNFGSLVSESSVYSVAYVAHQAGVASGLIIGFFTLVVKHQVACRTVPSAPAI